VASRLFHAKNDKEVIAAWRLDLNRVLHVFNVRSAGSVLLPLTSPLQTELAINTHAMVVDIHHRVVAGQEGTDRQHRSVSMTPYPPTTGCSPFPRLSAGQPS